MLRFLPQIADVNISIDTYVLSFSFVLGLITALAFGLAPSLQATKLSLTPALTGGNLSCSFTRSNLRKGLVVLQIALSMLLLTGAGLFTRFLRNLESTNPGFDRESLLLFSVAPVTNGYTPEQAGVFYQKLLDRVRLLRVLSAAMANSAPLNYHTENAVFIEGYQPSPDEPSVSPDVTVITPGYFATAGIPLLLERDLTDRDAVSATPVAAINETFAKRYFSEDHPVGKRLGFSQWHYDVEIVGVVKDSKYSDLRESSTPMLYLPHSQYRPQGSYYLSGSMVVYLRMALEPMALATAVRSRSGSLTKTCRYACRARCSASPSISVQETIIQACNIEKAPAAYGLSPMSVLQSHLARSWAILGPNGSSRISAPDQSGLQQRLQYTGYRRVGGSATPSAERET